MKNIFSLVVLHIFSILFSSFNFIVEPTKKETFDFIVHQCSYFSKDDLQKKATKINGYNYNELSIDLIEYYPNWTSYPTIKLEDIKLISWNDENRDWTRDIEDQCAQAMGLPIKTSDIYIYFKIDFKQKIEYQNSSFTNSKDYIKFSFNSKIEAKKMYKALKHLQKLVEVNKDLFNDK